MHAATPRRGATTPNVADPIWLSWSSGKDSAWTLHELRMCGCTVRGLLTSCSAEHDRVAMHGVRRELLEAQATSLGLPLVRVDLPAPCTNADYEARMHVAFDRLRDAGVTGIAFGDLRLDDVRAYRERQVEAAGLDPWFPLFGRDTRALAERMIDGGLRAVLTCVDPTRCPPELVGSRFDHDLLARLPASVDPCGENGEFHTFAFDGPGFATPLVIEPGPVVERDGFVFADFVRSAEESADGR